MFSHFHMDPVWWNTQAATIDGPEFAAADWSASPRIGFQMSVIDVLLAHLAAAEADPDLNFCVSEVDYLEPFWLHHPHQRERFRRLLSAGRVEVVGGSFNEPNTNLVSAETSRRNLERGLRFHRDVLGADVATAWQLDVFGHDPGYPGVLAEAGLTSVVYARGPYGPWGTMLRAAFDEPGDPDGVSFPILYEWVGPDGVGITAAYLAAHYSTGYQLDRADTPEDAFGFVERLGRRLHGIGEGDDVMLPIGSDLSPPSRWLTEVTRMGAGDGAVEPVASSPSRFFDALRARPGPSPFSPQTRHLDPVYTGKDVTHIGIKQAHRAVEALAEQADRWSTLAATVAGTPVPVAELDDLWGLLVAGSHHDAITGTHSDQVYLDLLAGWRRAHDLARSVRDRSLAALSMGASPAAVLPPTVLPLTVRSATLGRRRDLVEIRLTAEDLEPLVATGLELRDDDGDPVPFVAEAVERDAEGRLYAAVLRALVSVDGIGAVDGQRLDLVPGPELPTWTETASIESGSTESGCAETTVEFAGHTIVIDGDRGGAITTWRTPEGHEVVRPGAAADAVTVTAEHPQHPVHAEGPWHLLPIGAPLASTADEPAQVRVSTSPIGTQVVVDGVLDVVGTRVPWRRTASVWDGLDRLDVTLEIDPVGADRLVRIEWPTTAVGATAVGATAEAVVARCAALDEVDTAVHPWTYDTCVSGWLAASTTAVVTVDAAGSRHRRAIAVAEVILGAGVGRDVARRLVVGLAARGVTATVTSHDGPRTGVYGIDSNLPDVRFSLGIAEGDAHTSWVPASRPLAEVWRPDMDLRALDALPLLTIEAPDPDALDATIDRLLDDLGAGTLTVAADRESSGAVDPDPPPFTTAILERGTPSAAFLLDGTLRLSLLRGSTGWPSGQWIDPPRRTTPNGEAFHTRGWRHRFEYSVLVRSGDWRDADLVRVSQHHRHPLVATVGAPTPVPEGSVASLRDRNDRPDLELRSLRTRTRTGQHPALVGEARFTESFGARSTGAFASVVEPVGPIAAGARPLEPSARPVWSRWWTQSRGPRTSDVGPVAVQLHPGSVLDPTWRVSLSRARIFVDPGLDDAELQVELAIESPGGGLALPDRSVWTLPPDGTVTVPLAGRVPDALDRGHHLVRATATTIGTAHPGWRSFDERLLTARAVQSPLEFLGAPPAVELAPGEACEVAWTLANRTSSERWGELDLLSPWGTWHLIDEPIVGVEFAAGACTAVPVTVRVPLDAAAGTWWWLARARVGSTTIYSASAPLVVTG